MRLVSWLLRELAPPPLPGERHTAGRGMLVAAVLECFALVPGQPHWRKGEETTKALCTIKNRACVFTAGEALHLALWPGL